MCSYKVENFDLNFDFFVLVFGKMSISPLDLIFLAGEFLKD